MTSVLWRTTLAGALLLFTAAALTGSGQIRPREEPPLIIKSTFGADLYKFYCSSCHGMDAKGRPARSPEHLAAPDLTILARDHGGKFPREAVRETIARGGKTVSSHGTQDMPVWGAIFRGLDSSDTLVEIRIANLVQYIESLQDLP
jgi:mono/diheme cytochrome c family protein